MNYQADRFTVLVDACVLVSALKRNMLLSLAEAQMFRARWSPDIMEETERAISKLYSKNEMKNGDELAKEQCRRMNLAFDDACISGYQPLIPALEEVHVKDRHVLAAAIKTSASVIATDNLKDFPAEYCAQFDIEPQSTDTFFANCIELSPPPAMAALQKMRLRFNNPAITPESLIVRAEGIGLLKTASLMQKYQPNL